MSDLVLRRAPADEPPGSELLAAMVGHLDTLYARAPDEPPRASATPEELSEARGGAFVVGELDGEPVACGGLKRLDAEVAEVKRMYVAPAARSRGIARAVLAQLEVVARELGYARVRLDVGALQPHALALYASAGYHGIGDYNANRCSVWWGEKQLTAR